MCDGGDRYAGSHYSPVWLAAQGLDPQPHEDMLKAFFETGVWQP
jgi:cysteine synthase A